MARISKALRSRSGVRLELREQRDARGELVGRFYRLVTLRPARPRTFADRLAAEDAFDLEVIASLCDTTVQRRIQSDPARFA